MPSRPVRRELSTGDSAHTGVQPLHERCIMSDDCFPQEAERHLGRTRHAPRHRRRLYAPRRTAVSAGVWHASSTYCVKAIPHSRSKIAKRLRELSAAHRVPGPDNGPAPRNREHAGPATRAPAHRLSAYTSPHGDEPHRTASRALHLRRADEQRGADRRHSAQVRHGFHRPFACGEPALMSGEGLVAPRVDVSCPCRDRRDHAPPPESQRPPGRTPESAPSWSHPH